MPVSTQGPQAGPGEGSSETDATPGMKVLLSLQKTAAGRLERYKATTAGQQSKANLSIPPPKHPGGNGLAVTPVEEVHQLPADVPRVQVGSLVELLRGIACTALTQNSRTAVTLGHHAHWAAQRLRGARIAG